LARIAPPAGPSRRALRRAITQQNRTSEPGLNVYVSHTQHEKVDPTNGEREG
jgi:hypothetical protein